MRRFIKALLCVSVIVSFSCGKISSQSFQLSAVSDLSSVFGDGYRMPLKSDTMNIFGIRGEVISGQMAIYAKKSLENVSVSLSSFKDASGSLLPSDILTWNFVGMIPLTSNTPNQPAEVLSRPAPASYPDYLTEDKTISMKARTYRSAWLTVNIPQNAKAGTYRGTMVVKGNKEERALPVCIRIFPLMLPSDRHLKVVEWQSMTDFDKFHGIKEMYSREWFDMLKKYADNMVSHRQNIFQVPVNFIDIRKSADGHFDFDFTRFDQIADVFWNTKKMDMLETGFLANFGKGDWFSPEVVLRDFNVTDAATGTRVKMSGDQVAPSLITAMESHLREKGWLNKTLFHVRDEPSVHNALSWKDMSDYIHKYGPDLKRGDAIETTFLLDDINIACPKLDHFATWYDVYKAWGEKKGNELWFYTVGIFQGSLFPDKTLDMPLIDSRLMHWLNYKYDASGYLHWGYNQWDDDPFNKVGEHFGDAWHVYPGKDGVLNSLRWEEMRNGIQDYEYFWMLENKIKMLKDSLGSHFSWIDPKQRSKEIAGEVIKDFSDFTYDPQVLYKARMKVLNELLDFDKSPRIYFQTNPSANTTLTEHSSVEVLGWTEPGTKIIINGTEVPVSADGLFLEQCGGDFIDPLKLHLGNKITIQAIGPNGTRTLTRDYVIR